MLPRPSLLVGLALTVFSFVPRAFAAPQGEGGRPEGGPPGFGGPGEFGGPGGFNGPGGRMGGPGGMMGRVREIVKDYDKDGDHRLNREERQAARAGQKSQRGNGGPGMGRRGGGPPGGGMFGGSEKATPGIKIAPADVPSAGDAPLYEGSVLRTLFLDFEDADWEAEMADFYHTDVDVPATLTVDGKRYPQVGVRFRGASSYFAVPAGSKRSLNLSLDWADSKQRLLGHKTLNLLNSHEDPTFLHTVLYMHVARQYTPAPKANFVRVVVNGENWGVYTSAEQFDKEMLGENYKSSKGWRWKVQGSPGGRGGLEYLGEEFAPYKQIYSLKSSDSDGDKPWRALVSLCYYLDQTEPEHLVEALEPVLDIDSALWFLALEIVLVNNDGYWIRASDYAMFTDAKGKFHIVPHDANETFSGNAGGPGMPGGFGGGRSSGAQLDPLIGMQDLRKPLRSKLLAVPALRAKYLGYVKRIATEWLDWEKLGPVVAQYRALLDEHVKADTKKLSSYEQFQATTADALPNRDGETGRGRGRQAGDSIRAFAEARRKYLLAYPDPK